MHEERRSTADRRNVEFRMLALEEHQATCRLELEHNRNSMEANTKAIQEFIDIAKGLKFGLKFLAGVEAIAVWIAKIVAAGAIVWGTWKFLVKEAIAHIIK